jgi:predicted RNA polymerase sigma factor
MATARETRRYDLVALAVVVALIIAAVVVGAILRANVRLNRAIAVAEIDGPQVAMAEVDGLPLEDYHAYHATRAHLLRRPGRSEESRAAYDRAIELAGNTAETAYLRRRRDQLAGPCADSDPA